MYLMTCTRPDLAYPLSILARYVAPAMAPLLAHERLHWRASTAEAARSFLPAHGVAAPTLVARTVALPLQSPRRPASRRRQRPASRCHDAPLPVTAAPCIPPPRLPLWEEVVGWGEGEARGWLTPLCSLLRHTAAPPHPVPSLSLLPVQQCGGRFWGGGCEQEAAAPPLSLTAARAAVHRYLCSTSGMGLVLGGRGPVVLTGHADASLVGDSATQRSSQGYTFSLGSGSVSWRSTHLSSVLSSSCEAEIYARAMAAQELHWLTYLLTDLGERPHSSPVLTKHIALRYFLARELQQRGQLRLAYVATRANTADIFTKALQPGDHQPFFAFLDVRIPTTRPLG
ncbi:unnamed protein product [Closterium sp. NIES-53]